jgi:hypothetical protein
MLMILFAKNNWEGCEIQPRTRRCKRDEIYITATDVCWEGVESRMIASQKTCLK